MTEPFEDAMIRFVDGAMSADEAAAFLAANPGAAAQAERWRAQAASLRAAFDPVLDEPAPTRLLQAAQQTPRANVLAFRLPAERPRWESLAVAAAAALAVGLGLGLTMRPGTGATMIADAGGFIARGSLARALDAAASGSPAENVRVLLTIPDSEGGHCRAFLAGDQSGLACRDPAAPTWRIVALVEQPPAPGGGDYRPASGPPEALLAAIETRRAGDPLDATQERTLIKQKWR